MGWTGCRRGAKETKLQFLSRVSSYAVGHSWPAEPTTQKCTVIALREGRKGVYGLLKVEDLVTGKSFVTALVILMQTRKGETLYKDMTETSGPNEAYMPLSMLRRLSPVEELDSAPEQQEWAREWRLRCEQNAALHKALVTGARFSTIGAGFTFKGLGAVTEFEVLDARKRIFMANPGQPTRFSCRLRMDCLEPGRIQVHAPTATSAAAFA